MKVIVSEVCKLLSANSAATDTPSTEAFHQNPATSIPTDEIKTFLRSTTFP